VRHALAYSASRGRDRRYWCRAAQRCNERAAGRSPVRDHPTLTAQARAHVPCDRRRLEVSRRTIYRDIGMIACRVDRGAAGAGYVLRKGDLPPLMFRPDELRRWYSRARRSTATPSSRGPRVPRSVHRGGVAGALTASAADPTLWAPSPIRKPLQFDLAHPPARHPRSSRDPRPISRRRARRDPPPHPPAALWFYGRCGSSGAWCGCAPTSASSSIASATRPPPHLRSGPALLADLMARDRARLIQASSL
jgi:hypothetical protein